MHGGFRRACCCRGPYRWGGQLVHRREQHSRLWRANRRHATQPLSTLDYRAVEGAEQSPATIEACLPDRTAANGRSLDNRSISPVSPGAKSGARRLTSHPILGRIMILATKAWTTTKVSTLHRKVTTCGRHCASRPQTTGNVVQFPIPRRFNEIAEDFLRYL